VAKTLTGVISALLTPFHQDQQIDETSLRRLIQFNLKQGIDGLYVGGSTGEAFLESREERQRVLEIVAEEAKGKIALIAHVGSISTAESRALADAAATLGYDAVSAVTPFYYSFSFNEHCNHYRDIIASSKGLPMIVYNIPAMSGVTLDVDQITYLLNIPGVVALKQTSGNLYQIEQIRRANKNKIIYNGYDEIFLYGQMAGANGGIGSTYNVMAWRYLKIMQAISENNIEKAKSIQSECNSVIDALIKSGVFLGLKNILHYMGIIENPICRRPFAEVEEKHLPALRAIAEHLKSEFGQL
jgi:N-acetylneuraminate lyase